MRIASSYLEDRALIVETEGSSTEVKITTGVAQGSVGGHTEHTLRQEAAARTT